jgi:hypothetical protein
MGSSPSAASAVYQAARAPQPSANSFARSVLPAPARPVTMVEAQEARPSRKTLSRRGRETRGLWGGAMTFS